MEKRNAVLGTSLVLCSLGMIFCSSDKGKKSSSKVVVTATPTPRPSVTPSKTPTPTPTEEVIPGAKSMAECNGEGKVWIASPGNNQLPTCGEALAPFECCKAQILARFILPADLAGRLQEIIEENEQTFKLYNCGKISDSYYTLHWVIDNGGGNYLYKKTKVEFEPDEPAGPVSCD